MVNRELLTAMDAVLDSYAANPTASQSEAGRAIGRAKPTVGGYLAELEAAGLVEREPNGQGVIVKARWSTARSCRRKPEGR